MRRISASFEYFIFKDLTSLKIALGIREINGNKHRCISLVLVDRSDEMGTFPPSVSDVAITVPGENLFRKKQSFENLLFRKGPLLYSLQSMVEEKDVYLSSLNVDAVDLPPGA